MVDGKVGGILPANIERFLSILKMFILHLGLLSIKKCTLFIGILIKVTNHTLQDIEVGKESKNINISFLI